MKRTESEEERNDFKNALKGHCFIPIWLTFSLFFMYCLTIKHVDPLPSRGLKS